MNLEVPLDVPGQYAVHVERTFVIDGDGVVPIAPQDRSCPLVPGSSA